MSDPISLDHNGRKIRLVAYYLPQFHPFPENDQWWGKGFTEWTNVTKAEPLFVGHYQPHLPADLGFYDLRVPEIRHQQIEMAKAHGIDAFCYHFYWFSGKRLMERPLDDMLADPKSDMPFCLCWANENWTRRWDGSENEILIAQRYLPEDPVNSIKAMEPYLRDPRYLTHEGKKLIVVYVPQHLPDSAAWIEAWRSYARTSDLGELHVVCAMTHGNRTYKNYGFDGGVEFPPHNFNGLSKSILPELGFREHFTGPCIDYNEMADLYLNQDRGDETDVFRCVYPSWDNTARRKSLALVTLNSTPENYEYWLHRAIEKTRHDFPDKDRLVFINAWNEWAEGCHLEPDRKIGHGYLTATARAKRGSDLQDWPHKGVPSECGPIAQKQAVQKAQALLVMVPKRRTTQHKRDTWMRRSIHSLRDALRTIRGRRPN